MTSATTSSPVVVTDTLDWDRFAAEFWDRGPLHVRGVAAPPFVADEVFAAAVRACDPDGTGGAGGGLPANVQLTVERRRRDRSDGALPVPSDGSLAGYHERVGELLGGRRYALIAHAVHAFHPPQWRRERDFYGGLWQRVGQPGSSAITTLFHGTYEHSPVGVHKDRFATFMYCLSGRKRMRFWPTRPWTEPVSTVLDYRRHLPGSFAVEVDAGDLLYWPAAYFHVGESVGDAPATSVNVGVPREGHRVAYDLEALLTDGDGPSVADPDRLVRQLPPVTAPTLAGPPDGGLPAALREAVGLLGGRLGGAAGDDRVAVLALRHRTSGGFAPVPPPAPVRPVEDGTALRAVGPVVHHPETPSLVGAAGHAVRTALPAPAVAELVARLASGARVRAADVASDPADRAGTCDLLAALESVHGVVRDG